MDENPKDGNQETQEPQDKASTPEDVTAIKAQLDEEQKAKSALEQALVARDEAISEKDARLAELETALSEAKKESEALTASLKEARDQTVTKYLTIAKTLNPTIPQDIIVGETIEEIDRSIEKGKALVASVTQYLESEASKAKVPAGAPTRGTISFEGMSPKEKIAYGIQQKGGVS
jgi:septal ring factor EnvC (AmiA/AmiB activator)